MRIGVRHAQGCGAAPNPTSVPCQARPLSRRLGRRLIQMPGWRRGRGGVLPEARALRAPQARPYPHTLALAARTSALDACQSGNAMAPPEMHAGSPLPHTQSGPKLQTQAGCVSGDQRPGALQSSDMLHVSGFQDMRSPGTHSWSP